MLIDAFPLAASTRNTSAGVAALLNNSSGKCPWNVFSIRLSNSLRARLPSPKSLLNRLSGVTAGAGAHGWISAQNAVMSSSRRGAMAACRVSV